MILTERFLLPAGADEMQREPIVRRRARKVRAVSLHCLVRLQCWQTALMSSHNTWRNYDEPGLRCWRTATDELKNRNASLTHALAALHPIKTAHSTSPHGPHLAWRLSGPASAGMCECAHLLETEQPRDCGYMQFLVMEITDRQIVAQALKNLSEV
jgi:hypothetical protein